MAAGVCGVWVLKEDVYKRQEEETEQEAIVKTVFEIDAKDISEIKLEYNGKTSTFLHENDVWSYAEDEAFPLSESAMLLSLIHIFKRSSGKGN